MSRYRVREFACARRIPTVFFCSGRLESWVAAEGWADMKERKRLLVVTPGNLRQSHLYIREHYDFSHPDCVGPARESTNREVEILLDGLDETVKTDIATDGRTGKPRGFFRARTWVRRFFEHHNVS